MQDQTVIDIHCHAAGIGAGNSGCFISPTPISPKIKFSIGALTGLALYSYLLLAGRGDHTGEKGNRGIGEKGSILKGKSI